MSNANSISHKRIGYCVQKSFRRHRAHQDSSYECTLRRGLCNHNQVYVKYSEAWEAILSRFFHLYVYVRICKLDRSMSKLFTSNSIQQKCAGLELGPLSPKTSTMSFIKRVITPNVGIHPAMWAIQLGFKFATLSGSERRSENRKARCHAKTSNCRNKKTGNVYGGLSVLNRSM